MAAIAGLACLFITALPAGAETEGYRLLEFEGAAVKWGAARLGAGARVTWALQEGTRHDTEAINCRHTTGLDGLLAQTGIGLAAFREQAKAAFAMWQASAGISFAQAAPGEAPDIVIGAQISPRGIAWTNVEFVVPAQAEVPARLTRAAICLNPQAAWRVGVDGASGTYDLRRVIAHEIGHAIGLDHPGSRGPLMGFAYQENVEWLTAGDTAGAVRLYGARRGPDIVETSAGALPLPGRENAR